MKDTIKEKLNSIRNEMTHTWCAIFVVGGSSIALLNKFSIWNYTVGLIGIFFTILLFNAYFIQRKEVFKLIKQMEELQ